MNALRTILMEEMQNRGQRGKMRRAEELSMRQSNVGRQRRMACGCVLWFRQDSKKELGRSKEGAGETGLRKFVLFVQGCEPWRWMDVIIWTDKSYNRGHNFLKSRMDLGG